MGIIRQLPPALANQIAAGEVVERPASVVKELVENAIDAESTTVTIELKDAGIQQIRITDNGVGMAREDLLMAFQPHATSKIYDEHDLFQIRSLGFRGEALASIGSVSKVTAESTPRSAADEGYSIKIEDSKVIHEGPALARQGTMMQVDSLFYNTPARLKHLKTLNTEMRHILNFVQNIALAYPSIRFELLSEGKRIFQSYGNGDLLQAIASVYQPSLARQLLPMSGSDQDFQLQGYVSPPQMTRTSRQYIHWLINGRPVRSYPLTEALVKAYGRQLMIGRFPLAVIDIQLDPRLVDVNVHPTKQYVRLSKEETLSHLVEDSVSQALSKVNPVPGIDIDQLASQAPSVPLDPTPEVEAPAPPLPVEQVNLMTDALTQPIPASDRFKDAQRLQEGRRQPYQVSAASQPPYQEADVPKIQADKEVSKSLDTRKASFKRPKVDFTQLTYIGQVHGTYLIMEYEDGFYLVDQHAAHERVRYEQLMNYQADIQLQQELLLPMIFEFSPSDMTVLEERQSFFTDLGLELTPLGPNTMQLTSYPIWLEPGEVEEMIQHSLDLARSGQKLTVAQALEQSLVMMSCRGAIKANHYLPPAQAEALVQSMAALEDPYHCPHGRPIFIDFDTKTIEKLFKRIQDPHTSSLVFDEAEPN